MSPQIINRPGAQPIIRRAECIRRDRALDPLLNVYWPTEALMTNTSKLVLFALAATVGACGEAVAPRSQASTAPYKLGGGVTTSLSVNDTVRFSITINPWENTYYNLGAGNTLTFPAGSVCDPTTSSYGPTEWDKACDPAHDAVTVNVQGWLDSLGHPRVDFTPHLRFVPSDLPAGWVNITFADAQAALDPMFNIAYCPDLSSACIDESTVDPSLQTTSDPVTGQVTRRIKHFSGYLVGAGDDALSLISDLNRVGASKSSPLNMRVQTGNRGRSGYILVSGRK
jgi:hypothetical protein